MSLEDIGVSRLQIGGGAYPDIELSAPVMALLSSEHMTVQERWTIIPFADAGESCRMSSVGN